MNSFLSGLTNTFSRMTAAPVAQTPSILLQAIGAAMRGESPSDFMKNLANSYPQLKPYNFDNLPSAAQQVCQQNGVNPQNVASQLDSIISPYIK